LPDPPLLEYLLPEEWASNPYPLGRVLREKELSVFVGGKTKKDLLYPGFKNLNAPCSWRPKMEGGFKGTVTDLFSSH
jgi:hypothetical protein